MRRPLDMRHREIAQQVGLGHPDRLDGVRVLQRHPARHPRVGLTRACAPSGSTPPPASPASGWSPTATAVVRQRPMAGSHARTLLPLIDEVARRPPARAAGDVDLLAVSIGPGLVHRPAHRPERRQGPRPGVGDCRSSACPRSSLRARRSARGRARSGRCSTPARARSTPPAIAGSGRRCEAIAAPVALVAGGRWPSAPTRAVHAGRRRRRRLRRALVGGRRASRALRLADCAARAAAWSPRSGSALLARGRRRRSAALEPRYCRRSEAELHRAGIAAGGRIQLDKQWRKLTGGGA